MWFKSVRRPLFLLSAFLYVGHHLLFVVQQAKMKSTLLQILSFLILSICAHTSPIPLDPSSFSSRNSIPHPPSHSDLSSTQSQPDPLSKRANEGEIFKSALSLAQDSAEPFIPKTAIAEHSATAPAPKAKDPRRKAVIGLAFTGLGITIGWNFISLQSFLSNREKYRREQRRLEAEKKKPPPKVGDVICTVETYSTEDQVAERKPGSLRVPCYRLGSQDGVGEGVQGTQAGVQNVGGVMQQAQQGMGGFAAAAYGGSPSRYSYNRGSVGASVGGLTKRTFPSASSEIIEEATDVAKSASTTASDMRNPIFHSPFSPYSPNPSSFSQPTPPDNLHHWIPLSSLPRSPSPSSERARLLNSPSRSEFAPHRRPKVPGTAVPLRTSPSTESFSDLSRFDRVKPKVGMEKKKVRLQKSWLNLLKGRRRNGKELTTEEITFFVTVLNTIGGLPSLALTTANAIHYRGNPRVD